ncbi:hypothetical protein BLOT_010868 [Blomia tropicalis]|nr:hypothetical protein BLOT_010868 [Blomia tropicalis]
MTLILFCKGHLEYILNVFIKFILFDRQTVENQSKNVADVLSSWSDNVVTYQLCIGHDYTISSAIK